MDKKLLFLDIFMFLKQKQINKSIKIGIKLNENQF